MLSSQLAACCSLRNCDQTMTTFACNLAQLPQIGFPMIATQFWAFSFILGNSGKLCCKNAKNITYMLKKLFFQDFWYKLWWWFWKWSKNNWKLILAKTIENWSCFDYVWPLLTLFYQFSKWISKNGLSFHNFPDFGKRQPSNSV